MNTRAEISLQWADGSYTFALKCKQLEELERTCGAPFSTVGNRVLSMEPAIKDITETIRLGLIGGGLDPVKAKSLIDTYVDGHFLFGVQGLDDPLNAVENPSAPAWIARAIWGAVYYGVDELDLGAASEPGKPIAGG